MVFSVILEVHPKSAHWSTYLSGAKTLRLISENIVGYVDSIRYRSFTRDGWIPSLSSWENEKALTRWRTTPKHHDMEELGRKSLLHDYHLRVGQNLKDTVFRYDDTEAKQRLDETEMGEGMIVTFIDIAKEPEWVNEKKIKEVVEQLGFSGNNPGLVD